MIARERIENWVLTGIDFAREEPQFTGADGAVVAIKLPAAAVSRDAWIRSRENPMFFRPAPLNDEVRSGWQSLPAARRTAIIEFYRSYGWDLKVDQLADRVWVEFRPVHLREQSAELNAEYTRFRDSLPPADAKIFGDTT